MDRGAVHPQTSSGRPRKLRESCIGCSSSKVKCNKEKPTCSRCVRRGLSCEYMVSRRTGRTRAVDIDRPATTSNTATTSTSTSTTAKTTSHRATRNDNVQSVEVHLTPPTDAVANARSTAAAAASASHHHSPAAASHAPPKLAASGSLAKPQNTGDMRPPQEPEPYASILSPNETNCSDLSSLLDTNADFGQLLPSWLTMDMDAEAEPDADVDADADADAEPDEMETDQRPRETAADLSVADSCSLFFHGTTGTDALLANPLPAESGPCCLSVCLDILKRLFPNAPVDCQRPGSQDGPRRSSTIDAVIADNKQIIDTMQTVLECRCAKDEYVVTLISLVVSKMLSWYVAVAQCRPSDANRVYGFGWAGSGLPYSASFEEQVLPLPAIVGSYRVDGHNQSRMAAQLVLSELHRVQRLVTLVGRRLEVLRQRPSSESSSASSRSGCSSVTDLGSSSTMLSETASPLSLSSTLSHLEDDLRKQLRAVSSETINMLRRA